MNAWRQLFENFQQASPTTRGGAGAPPAPAQAALQPTPAPAPRAWLQPTPPQPDQQTRFEERSDALIREFGGYPGMLNSRAAWSAAADAEGVPHEVILAEIATNNPRVEQEAREEEIRLRTMPAPRDPTPLAEDLRESRMSNTYQMSQEDYDALTDRQKAVVQFNTGMLEAAALDDEAGNTDATTEYLARLGIETRSDRELDEFLQLDRLITESILEKLGDKNALLDSASTMRWARGDIDAAGDGRRVDQARSIGEIMAPELALSLATTGSTSLMPGQAPRPGYGTSLNDMTVQEAYLNMIDSRFELTPKDIAEGIATANAARGSTTTPQDVWDYLSQQLAAVEFGRKGDEPGRLLAPETDPVTGETFTALDVAEIRRRYGL